MRDAETGAGRTISANGPNLGGRALVANLEERLAALALMSHAELRAEWRWLFRAHPPQRIGRDVLELGAAWKLQEKALGGTSGATKRRLAELDRVMESKGDLAKARTIRLRPGAKLVREWRGETHDVFVTESGFLWRGESWRSLSAIALEITGTHWSGLRFFGLTSAVKRAGDGLGAVGAEAAQGAVEAIDA